MSNETKKFILHTSSINYRSIGPRLSISEECARNHKVFQLEQAFTTNLKDLGYSVTHGVGSQIIYENELKEM